jgi:hypothetical protein
MKSLYKKAIVVAAVAAIIIVFVTRSRQPGEGTSITYSLIVPGEASKLKNIPQYDLECHLGADARSYTGRLSVTVPAALTDVSELLFHIPPNYERSQAGNKEKNTEITSVQVHGKPVSFRDETSLLWVSIPKDTQTKEVKVDMTFTSKLPELKLPATFLQSNMSQLLSMLSDNKREQEFYGLYSYANDTASLANWYPILARRDSHSHDTQIPNSQGDITNFDVANYRVKISAPTSVVVAASGTLVSTKATDDKTTTSEYVGAGLREFTINASTRYKFAKREVQGITLYSYYYPEDEQQGRRALDIGAEALVVFNRDFGRYPFRELRIVEAPIGGSAGGMEYSGLVTVAQQFYSKFDARSIPILEKLGANTLKPMIDEIVAGQLEWVVAHEVAHQWWHGLVGNNEKELPFVDESLTNFSTYHFIVSKYGKEKAKRMTYPQLNLVYQIDRLNGGQDGGLLKSASSFASPMSYGAQIYSKGALHYVQLQEALGDDLFFAVLKEYVKRYAFSHVDAKAFDTTLADVLHARGQDALLEKATLLRERWLHGSYGDADIGTFSITAALESIGGPAFFSGPDGMKRRLLLNLLEPVVMNLITRR